MSNQSGISVSPALAREFPQFVSSSDVAAILAIDHSKEHVDLEHRVSGAVADIREHLGAGSEAKYIILRLPGDQDDEENTGSFAFIQFMPDLAPLSSKMKYASSHATVHRQLGGSSTFSTTIFWTNLDEVSDRGIRAHRDHEDAPAPLTEEEQSLATVKEHETARGTRGTSVAGQSTLAIHANVSSDATKALNSTESDTAAIFKVSSDEKESIELTSTVSVSELARQFSELDEPRYVVANINDKRVFAFVCPRSASIKQRMLFASTRISFLEYIKTQCTVDTIIETFDPINDLKLENLLEEVSPERSQSSSAASTESLGSSRPRFQRPRPPKRR